MKHIPRKRFGQHFLTDPAVIDAIVRAIDPKPGDALVEIGPGLAALTQPLAERAGRLTVIELDRDLAARLRADPRLTVIEADALKVDFGALQPSQGQGINCPKATLNKSARIGAPGFEMGCETQSAAIPGGIASICNEADRPNPGCASREGLVQRCLKSRICGNLPYNISTPLLFHLLPWAEQIADQHFMLQKEVVDRMTAVPATHHYGRLSVMLQWRYAMQPLLAVAPAAFSPPPRVDSAVVRMVPRPDVAPVDVRLLSELVQTAFSQRRKLLRHTLGRWLDARGFADHFDTQRRAEEVPVAEYVALAQAA